MDFVAHCADQRIGNQAARAGMFQRRCQRQRTAKQEHRLEIDGLQCLFLADDAGQDQNDGANRCGNLQLDADLLFKHHGKNGDDEHSQRHILLPLGNMGVILDSKLVIFQRCRATVFGQQLVAKQRKEENACQNHRAADNEVFEEARFDAQLVQGADAHQVARRTDDGDVAAQRRRENQRHQQVAAAVAAFGCNADHDGNEYGRAACVGKEPGHKTGDDHDGDDELAFRFGELSNQTADLVGHAGFKQRLPYHEHGHAENNIGIDIPGKRLFGFKDAGHAQTYGNDCCGQAQRNLFQHEHNDCECQKAEGDNCGIHWTLLPFVLILDIVSNMQEIYRPDGPMSGFYTGRSFRLPRWIRRFAAARRGGLPQTYL